jgi:hypothetical protein
MFKDSLKPTEVRTEHLPNTSLKRISDKPVYSVRAAAVQQTVWLKSDKYNGRFYWKS